MTSIALCLLFLFSGVVAGEDIDISPSKGIPLFLKIITYDENFNSANFELIKIFVLYDRRIGESYEQYLEVRQYFKDNPGVNVDGVPIKLQEVQVNSINDIASQISKSDYNLLVVTELKEDKVLSVAEFARSNGLHSYSLKASFVPLGIAIGIIAGKNSSSIQVNVQSSRLEGSKYSARLLKMCNIYEEEN